VVNSNKRGTLTNLIQMESFGVLGGQPVANLQDRAVRRVRHSQCCIWCSKLTERL